MYEYRYYCRHDPQESAGGGVRTLTWVEDPHKLQSTVMVEVLDKEVRRIVSRIRPDFPQQLIILDTSNYNVSDEETGIELTYSGGHRIVLCLEPVSIPGEGTKTIWTEAGKNHARLLLPPDAEKAIANFLTGWCTVVDNLNRLATGGTAPMAADGIRGLLQETYMMNAFGRPDGDGHADASYPQPTMRFGWLCDHKMYEEGSKITICRIGDETVVKVHLESIAATVEGLNRPLCKIELRASEDSISLLFRYSQMPPVKIASYERNSVPDASIDALSHMYALAFDACSHRWYGTLRRSHSLKSAKQNGGKK